MTYFPKLSCGLLFLTVGATTASGQVNNGPQAVKEVMDRAVTRLYQQLTPQQLDTIREPFILNFLSPADKNILATRYLTFEVNVPAVVSIMRDQAQKTLPFWLPASGFVKTGMVVKNEEYTYEVWQKRVNAGRVSLGINGFDKHRPVYFVSVGPQKAGDRLQVSNCMPSQTQTTMQQGAFTYHDWDDLVLDDVPDALKGQVLLQTIRGRAREAHLVGAFRKTTTPSTTTPDQLLLTWSGDPSTTMNVQWRTSPAVGEGQVQYWVAGRKDTLMQPANRFVMEDRLLQNDRYVHRFTGKLTGLLPGMTYGYRVGGKGGSWSAPATFTTKPAGGQGFSYIWFGDTHKSREWGQMAQKAAARHPEVAFYNIAGDLVSTGLHRDEWDELWQHSGGVFARKPLMPIPGNHDSQDGLGAWMYQEMFSLPENGPAAAPTEQTYAFTYQNALFLMIDGTAPVEQQTAWIKEQLARSTADWKFAFFHFPPYNYEEDYALIRNEWCSLFDQYHVDMVMSGHVHYYMRSKPMYAGKPVDSPAKGTVYTISVGIPGTHENMPPEDYAVSRYPKGNYYQHITINGKTMVYTCYNPDGQVKDELRIDKK